MMVRRKVRCRICGKRCAVFLPDRMSSYGVYELSICEDCRQERLERWGREKKESAAGAANTDDAQRK